ncbi:hypothetical protein [Aurantimonas sp. 22II-16-19i]|uniref:hypothetical protein n=1 Tax=Aurantimonas sp. 22II-16-19i TaxID=1317114 RepID=UPI0009F7CA46|nr:hypothetical protein [Aurantimonas sp. 22II-16-19i]ORE98853.1 hypothetical protein ATO4_00765 [Aurantimonas sp. 22II-16-19i]
MHDQNGSIVSQMSSPHGRPRPSPGERCIDGVAEVTSRRPIGKDARTRPAEPANPAAAFGRRDARSAAGGTANLSDRVDAEVRATSIEDAILFTPTPPAARRRRAISRAIPGRIGLAVCAFAFGAALLPALLVSFPETPVAATSSNGGGFEVRLGDVQAALSSHGDGKMLRIEGRIVNPGTRTAAVPPLRIDFADSAAGLRSRMLQTSVARLEAGRSIDFVSMIAVPEETEGEVRVGFFGTRDASRQ